MTLDPPSSTAGAMERVFLAETRSPGLPGYDADESLKAMRYMRQIIENRLNSHNPAYGAPRHAKTEIDVIKVGSQFQGFGKYPILNKPIKLLIAEILKIADRSNDPRAPTYAQFVSNAILAATEAFPPASAHIPANLVGWKTRQSASPGNNYIYIGTVQGNDFYTVANLEVKSVR